MPIRPLSRSAFLGLSLSLLCGAPASAQRVASETPTKLGHSAHGVEYDEGPREKPWIMENIGSVHVPITTAVLEAQMWFDQGSTLLHSFWYYEAERSFRWCLKLDPECAMAYLGMARAAGQRGGNERMQEFLREAVARKHKVSERERLYIEAWEAAYMPELSGKLADMDPDSQASRDRFKVLADKLELLCVAYPEDLEAKSLHALYALYDSSRIAIDALLQEVLALEPQHPGAHHYRIHNWDGPEGRVALESSAQYGRLAAGIGHANHMPGHIYSGIGMWHEGAIWMDSATRVEKRYMQERMIFPFNNWNYAHNRNYLSYIQEQLGMRDAALDGARQLLNAPHDPKYNNPSDGDRVVAGQGLRALVRGLVKYERWQEILDEGSIPWRSEGSDKLWRPYVEGLAHLGTGDLPAAIDDLVELEQQGQGLEGEQTALHELMRLELGGLLACAQGDELGGMRLLDEGAASHLERFEDDNDPPTYPRVLHNVAGELWLASGSPAAAVKHFEAVLEVIPNDGFALSGLTRAQAALGQREPAQASYARLLHVWSDADPDLRWLVECQALGLQAEPYDKSPTPQRNYARAVLDPLGPNTWKPYAAPRLEALDAAGASVTLEEYCGRNVLLVFYLGDECPHCVAQLQAIAARSADFGERDVDVLAISSDSPEDNAKSLAMGELCFRLLSDREHVNARRFKSYDDFEELDLHSTIWIDAQGRVRWARSGGDPFTDLDFLLGEIDRVDALVAN